MRYFQIAIKAFGCIVLAIVFVTMSYDVQAADPIDDCDYRDKACQARQKADAAALKRCEVAKPPCPMGCGRKGDKCARMNDPKHLDPR